MKTSKKYLLLIVSITLILKLNVFAIANEQNNIKSQIQNLSSKYNIEIITEDDRNINNKKSTNIVDLEDKIEISSLNELENLLIALNNKPKEYFYNQEINIKNKITQDSYTFTQWAPFQYANLGGPLVDIFTTKNCMVNFNYNYLDGRPYFDSIRSVESWIGGAFTTTWTQTGISVNIVNYEYYRDAMYINVTGYGMIGINYQSMPLFVKYSAETWNFTLRYVYN